MLKRILERIKPWTTLIAFGLFVLTFVVGFALLVYAERGSYDADYAPAEEASVAG